MFILRVLIFCFVGVQVAAAQAVMTNYTGLFDHLVPMQWEVERLGDDISVAVSFNDADGFGFSLEGTINEDNEVELYEYDSYSRVQGIVNGKLEKSFAKLEWINATYNRRIPIYLVASDETLLRQRIQLYEGKDEEGQIKYAFVRPADQLISINASKQIGLRWMRYECEQEDCIEFRPNQDLSNPVEFQIDATKDAERIVLFPSSTLIKRKELNQLNRCELGHTGYVSINYPVLGDIAFDNWISGEIDKRFLNLNSSIDADPEYTAENRFSFFAQGDYFITLLTDEMISGYLYFIRSDVNRVETVVFTYDRVRSKMNNINDLFKKDFDYAFFLNRYLDKARKNMLPSEDRMVRAVINQANFTHFVLSPRGLVFFTEFNSVFGRRHILVPFDNITTFIDNDAVELLIKNVLKS